MKLTRINTSRLALSWTADTPTVRAGHRHEGVVLLAADVAGIPDEDMTKDEAHGRMAVGFITDVIDVPRKPAMAAWNQKILTDTGVDFLAIETVSLTYTLNGAQTAADLIAAIKQIGSETGGAGHPVPLDQLLLGLDEDGATTLTVSLSAESTSVDLAALHTSLGDLPQTDGVVVVDDASVAEPKKRRTAKVPIKAADEPINLDTEVPEVEASAPEAPAELVEFAPEAVAEQITEQVIAAAAPEAPAVAEDIAEETLLIDELIEEAPVEVVAEPVSEIGTPAAVIEPVAAIEVSAPEPVPTPTPFVSAFGDIDDQIEPPEYYGPPEIDAPESETPEAPDMPEFDVESAQEPPSEENRRPAAARPVRKAATPIVVAVPAPAGSVWRPTLTLDGKIRMTEADIF